MASEAYLSAARRSEALLFAFEFQRNRAVPAPEAQTRAVTAVQQAAIAEFMNFARAHFIGYPDDTYGKLLKVLATTARRSELYSEVFVLLVGCTDFMCRFERCLDDGSEETRREIANLRVQARDNFLAEVTAEIANCKSVSDAMLGYWLNPNRTVTALQAQYIERVFSATNLISGDFREYHSCLRVRSGIWTALQKRLRVLLKIRPFVSDYFT